MWKEKIALICIWMRYFWDACDVLISTEYRKAAQIYQFQTEITMAIFCSEQIATMECGFTANRVRDMIRTYNQS